MSKSQNIRVICRIRPENEREKNSLYKSCIDVLSEKTVKINPVTNPNNNTAISKEEPHEFTFDHIFPNTTIQQDVFDYAAKPLINGLFEGINCTLFCYGQTSSGKTFTMEGIRNDNVLRGIIPRSMEFIFDKINSISNNIEFSVKCSYYQIYNEKIQDLLDTRKTDLQIREDKNKGIWVDNCTEIYVSNSKEMTEVFDCGANNRTVAATEMNKGSSRSHSLFVVTIFQKNTVTDSTKSAKVFFVDLAGSEKMSKTGITGGVGLKEAQNINKSLMTLGMVINALTENAQHVPYRDSKLTRVLQESIGGNSQTTLIITVTSNGSNQSESLSTLRFGQRAKLIKNKVVANTVKSVKELMIKIKELEEKIKKLESAKGKIDENDLKDSNDGNTITTHLRTKTDEDEICPNCEKYKTELMNKRVELITLNENIEDLTREKEDLEIEVKEKCNEIFNLNEKIFLSEAKDKLIMDDEAKLFDEISIKLETFTFFNQKKQKYLEDIKSLVNNNIKEQNIKKINNYLNEILSIIHLDSKNYKELLNLISNNSDSENSSTHFASHSGGNLNNKIDEEFKIHEKKNSDNTNDSFSKSKHSSLMRSKNSIKINNNNSFEILNKDHEEINAYKDLLSENDTLKNLNENYQLEKYQNEILIKKLNDQIKDFNKKISDKEEIIKDLNGKLCDVIQQFDEYKNQNILDFSTKEQKTIELINKISDLEDQNFKLIHFSKDSYKKKYSLMDKQIKQFTLQVQQLLTENSELKKKYERKLIESNNLQIKVDELQNKLSDIVKGTIIKDRFTYNMTTQSDLDMSFTNRSVCIPDPNNNNGKGYIMQNMNDLLKQNLQRDNKRNYNNNPFNQAYKNKKNINISNMINNRIIKIITGGNKQQ